MKYMRQNGKNYSTQSIPIRVRFPDHLYRFVAVVVRAMGSDMTQIGVRATATVFVLYQGDKVESYGAQGTAPKSSSSGCLMITGASAKLPLLNYSIS